MDRQDASSHFGFGENWKSYVALVDEAKISEAVAGLKRLIAEEDIKGKSFLDIGCGSGISLLAALRLGASTVQGVDIDQDSVDAARDLLSKFAPGGRWQVGQRSIFELDPGAFGQFDIIYSWGVLHHTGDMWVAVSKAASLVKKGGLLVIALYHKTPLCGLWRLEKRIYSRAGPLLQRLARGPYKAAIFALLLASRQNPRKYISEYKRYRGMDWHHDVHDWLGGYPYESALPGEVKLRLQVAGLEVNKIVVNFKGRLGLFGSGCDEFVARRV